MDTHLLGTSRTNPEVVNLTFPTAERETLNQEAVDLAIQKAVQGRYPNLHSTNLGKEFGNIVASGTVFLKGDRLTNPNARRASLVVYSIARGLIAALKLVGVGFLCGSALKSAADRYILRERSVSEILAGHKLEVKHIQVQDRKY